MYFEDAVTFESDGSAWKVKDVGQGYGVAKSDLLNFHDRANPRAAVFTVPIDSAVMDFEGHGQRADLLLVRTDALRNVRVTMPRGAALNTGFWRIFDLQVEEGVARWNASASIFVKKSHDTDRLSGLLSFSNGPEDGIAIPEDLLGTDWNDKANWPQVKAFISDQMHQFAEIAVLTESAGLDRVSPNASAS